jgi:hemerythrin-like domain-containing protein
MTPREHLRREHGATMKVLSRLQKWIREPGAPPGAAGQALEAALAFMAVYVDQCHHGKEEKILFPELEASGNAELADLVSELRREHELARGMLDGLRAACRRSDNGIPDGEFADQAKALIALVRTHVRKENARLLPAIESALPDAVQSRIEDAFERFEGQIEGLDQVRRAAGFSA